MSISPPPIVITMSFSCAVSIILSAIFSNPSTTTAWFGVKNYGGDQIKVQITSTEYQQYEIPFIVWCSDSEQSIKPLQKVGHYHVFHSVLNFLSIESPIYDESRNIFE